MPNLTALELRDRIAARTLTAADVAEACLAEVARREPEVLAWAWLDPDHVRRQAADLDAQRAAGLTPGPLHGVPVGLKDIVDTAGIPTENGCVLNAGRVPDTDALLVARLKAAGAVIMGKTVTSELANRGPGPTRNPHNTAHTPGGSSSGSAAAVAAGMVPLAVGTQTAGSVIRPAAYCGIVGFKPSFGLIPRDGVLLQSQTLDTIGTMGCSVADAALLAEVLADAPGLLAAATALPPSPPRFAFVRQPCWTDATSETRTAFEAFAARLGERCTECELPAPFDDALDRQRTVHVVEMAYAYRDYLARGRDHLFPATVERLDEGLQVAAVDYLDAVAARDRLNAALEDLFDGYDALLTPAAPGPAPEGLGSTGSPAFDAIWTLCGTPAITLPLLTAASGLPIGVQLVVRRGDDPKLLRTAAWLEAQQNA